MKVYTAEVSRKSTQTINVKANSEIEAIILVLDEAKKMHENTRFFTPSIVLIEKIDELYEIEEDK